MPYEEIKRPSFDVPRQALRPKSLATDSLLSFTDQRQCFSRWSNIKNISRWSSSRYFNAYASLQNKIMEFT